MCTIKIVQTIVVCAMKIVDLLVYVMTSYGVVHDTRGAHVKNSIITRGDLLCITVVTSFWGYRKVAIFCSSFCYNMLWCLL